jgi:hypothetical protein
MVDILPRLYALYLFRVRLPCPFQCPVGGNGVTIGALCIRELFPTVLF